MIVYITIALALWLALGVLALVACIRSAQNTQMIDERIR